MLYELLKWHCNPRFHEPIYINLLNLRILYNKCKNDNIARYKLTHIHLQMFNNNLCIQKEDIVFTYYIVCTYKILDQKMFTFKFISNCAEILLQRYYPWENLFIYCTQMLQCDFLVFIIFALFSLSLHFDVLFTNRYKISMFIIYALNLSTTPYMTYH